MLEIIPAILTNDPKELEAKISAVEGLVGRIQIDIIDGVFTDNKTIGLEAVGQIESGLGVDVHLMVKQPVDWVEKSTRAMADRIIGQIEMMSDQFEFVAKVQETGHQVGLALDLDTQVSKIEDEMLKIVDVVLLMSVKAGFGGQEFDHKVLEKVKELDSLREGDPSPFRICVDGGIGTDNIKSVADAGADEVVVGSSLYSGNIQENMNKLKEALG